MNRNEKVTKTRKKHNCLGCLKIIPIGSTAEYFAGVIDGEFTSSYMCQPCCDFVDEHGDYCKDDEGIIWEGMVAEGMREYANDQNVSVLPQAIEPNEQPSEAAAESEVYGNDCRNGQC